MPSGALGSAGERHSMRLAPSDRLRKRFEFRRLRDEGRRVHTRSFVLVIAPAMNIGGQPQPRLGITVSRQVGKAVRRNRLKRLVREVFRMNRALLPPASDLVVIARAGCRIDSAGEVAEELTQACAALAQARRRGPAPRPTRSSPGGRR